MQLAAVDGAAGGDARAKRDPNAQVLVGRPGREPDTRQAEEPIQVAPGDPVLVEVPWHLAAIPIVLRGHDVLELPVVEPLVDEVAQKHEGADHKQGHIVLDVRALVGRRPPERAIPVALRDPDVPDETPRAGAQHDEEQQQRRGEELPPSAAGVAQGLNTAVRVLQASGAVAASEDVFTIVPEEANHALVVVDVQSVMAHLVQCIERDTADEEAEVVSQAEPVAHRQQREEGNGCRLDNFVDDVELLLDLDQAAEIYDEGLVVAFLLRLGA
mmetsp:Transcript_63187/g.181757  ORF Transcript_63187/g.181757 Transcript_63187/m.181757 type:complete len:271 (-) Transcript_63187:854-1666(-)